MRFRPGADPGRQRRFRHPLVALGCALVFVGGCTPDPQSPGSTPSANSTATAATPSGEPRPSASTRRELATGLDVPWDLAVLPDGNILVTLRDRAEVVRVASDGSVTAVATIADVAPAGEGGLLGIALSPRFATDGFVFLYYSVAQENRVVRYRYTGSGLVEPKPIVTGIPRASNHNGGRLRFGPDGRLYIGTGNSGNRDLAQDLDSLGGKILRVDADGGIPSDNPFGTAVYSYGHRNVQGLGWDAAGHLFASEFGQDTFDELNLIRPGGNYGWPGAEGRTDSPGLVNPLLVWRPADASPSGIAVTPGGTVYVAALRGERVWSSSGDGDKMTEPSVFLDGLGRVRAVEVSGEDLLVLTNNTARGRPRSGDDRLIAVPLR
jgi:glucose/arabinose dehydrogenase